MIDEFTQHIYLSQHEHGMLSKNYQAIIFSEILIFTEYNLYIFYRTLNKLMSIKNNFEIMHISLRYIAQRYQFKE